MKTTLLALALSVAALPALAADPLTEQIAATDLAAFDAFNHCKDPAQLARHATFFAPDVEFYHDNGGVTWNRDAMLANTAKYVCGNFRRELVAGSLKVFPVKDFGAIAQGTHRFCQFASGKCEGMADFTVIWQLKDGQWQMTRVMSYGHRSVAQN
ncbi:nuclear transport factor 2 family protein [Janthinobacterium sp.]|uniref:nuclear transport factor 2 family protein n=1 Tax=Janthinobacterium sp. TaxID=1871054 RepID=UPI002DB8CABA|nr:nuclear transport factor 2 family protein [Janthinobacterium sp.]HEU4815901.1 nuclear transport factor 2 family protein [Janthinobacterium sp.]